jgi:beta-glucosidase
MRGVAALMAVLLVLSVVGTGIAETYRSQLDGALGTNSWEILTDGEGRFVSDYDTIEKMAEAAKQIGIRQGQEGTVVMKNDNSALPIASGKTVALFGLAAYAPYPYGSGDLKGGNADAVDLVGALKEAGVPINQKLKDFYDGMMNLHEKEVPNMWTGEITIQTAYDVIYSTSIGSMTPYQINEVSPARWVSEFGADANWKSWIDKENTVGIVVFARPAGEGNTYGPGKALDHEGNPTGKDPLQLADSELAVIDAAKESCSKVIVLLNTGNTMMIGDIAKGGDHEVDAIAYIGCPNDYHFYGIVDVLTGEVNATGALTDTYPVNHSSIPAMQNVGGDYYADYEIVGTNSDPRWPGLEIGNVASGSFGGGDTYNGGSFIVEAEGIYVGYKYYETRYYDSIMNPGSKADSKKGATQGNSWDYNKEVVYTFGHGLSFLEYTQTLKSIDVDKTPEGLITAVVTVTNKSNKDGKFLAQLYVQQPYTEYDKQNNVEKSAVTFLNSAKVDVKAGQSVDVTITIPTKYLASYDFTTAKTYILDEGDYYFTAANGSHEAVNNFLGAQGKTVADGMDAEATGSCLTWNCSKFDDTTFSVSNGTVITNVADNADLNYWLPGSVTYLSRQDWEGTYPINYNKESVIKIADSPKKDEWISELRGYQYSLKKNNPAKEGVDTDLKFSSEFITAEHLADIDHEFWAKLLAEVSIDEAVGAVIHGGSASDILTALENPKVIQNEGVNGFTAEYKDEESGISYSFNINSMTLLGTSFNPELAYDWGRVEGNSGLWLERYHLWGIGLTQRRTPYNGRNYEYVSEDPMLANVIGREVLQGCADKGILNGPKHMGFNDQEHNRAGISAYMHEQKFRETDLRAFQGALNDATGCRAVMIAFNRIGPVNAAHHVGMLQTILRQEWGFTGVVSTDMMNNKYYFCAEPMVMAGITQVADFAQNDNHINGSKDGTCDKTWPYISVETVKNDSEFVEQARQNLKYQLFTYANSAIMNIQTVRVQTWWDTALANVTTFSAIALAVSAVAWLGLSFVPEKKKEEV